MPWPVDWSLLSFRVVLGLLAAVAIVALLFPTAVILLLSLSGEESLHFPPASYSLRWYVALLSANEIAR